ncbi:BTB/POZ domain-containing protein At3g19850 isoform X1 [Ricinus communis]|uniref:BTB/POZ domain-containing protein At3g19850 isoform X1 n=1 Tax=Ricinus communis TaxID=3988 RepID=UPI00201B2DFC|nr:BTB/POZ domain-containing protein At3g19850 isoform X1 [Ricinus communis]
MQLCDLSIHVNGQQTFFLNQKVVSAYSGKLKKIIRQEKRKSQIKNLSIEIGDFPGGPDGFEMVSRFCYHDGRIEITVMNVCLLHCCAIFLGMTEKVSPSNLLKQTESFLEGIFYWSWNNILATLRSCESFFTYADSYGVVQKLIYALLAKIAQHSDSVSLLASSSSSSSSPETASGFRLSSSAKTSTPTSAKPSSGKQWWFDDLALLSPVTIEKLIKNLGAYGSDNTSLILTRFIIHYLKIRVPCRSNGTIDDATTVYGGLADTAVHGVIMSGKSAFSCRGMLVILRTVSGFGVSKDCRDKLERLIGSMLDKATLDDLLISGQEKGVYYDVKLVLRLIRTFVNNDACAEMVSNQRMKMVGRLVDKYLGEISPDHNLKMSKFLGVAESLPDNARDCFDGVYRAIDMYLQSHPTISFEERSRLCRCLNYEKLSFEACKDLAKNPRIPPNVAIEALKSQKYCIPYEFVYNDTNLSDDDMIKQCLSLQHTEDMKINIEKMQKRVFELEKACRKMKDHMSFLVKHNNVIPSHNRILPRLC